MGSFTKQKTGKDPRRTISTARILRSVHRIDDCSAPMAMGRAEPIGTTSSKPEWYPARPEKRGATRGLRKRSPILVLLSPKHAYLRSSDGIQSISAGMIAPVMFLCRCPLNPSFMIAAVMLSPAPCTTAHLPPHETCPHRSPTGPIPFTRRFHP